MEVIMGIPTLLDRVYYSMFFTLFKHLHICTIMIIAEYLIPNFMIQ